MSTHLPPGSHNHSSAFCHVLCDFASISYKPLHEKTGFKAYAKTKVQINCTVLTAKLISAFDFSTWIAQFLFFPNTKFQGSSLLLSLYRSVCIRPGCKPRRLIFSCCGSYNVHTVYSWKIMCPFLSVSSQKLTVLVMSAMVVFCLLSSSTNFISLPQLTTH